MTQETPVIIQKAARILKGTHIIKYTHNIVSGQCPGWYTLEDSGGGGHLLNLIFHIHDIDLTLDKFYVLLPYFCLVRRHSPI